ncbi:restriction endonuclease subunit S [Flammeovirga sp. EKP202]|uniref:restriction endonuclease subunit S n=1 Tax=Flammeovirga sp. EKP202 TaxID=2770592 RepID=UPI00165EC036|nr:restriction endonuclease subunit S [Flammeovirga sp. EKP202]MBD0403878.1 restriction endonuclease subunit S [Flammeovirga sp. EKP202]
MSEVKKNIPALRFPEFSSDDYKVHSFQDIFCFKTGKNIKQSEASPEFEIPCVRYGELYYMYKEVITKIVNKTSLDKSELLFSDGDEILLPSAGEDPLDIGSASALIMKNVAIGRTINILKPLKKGIYSQIYASFYINHRLRRKISTLAKGSSISNVYNSDLKKLKIVLPTLPEQQKIATFLSSVDKKIGQLTEKKELLEEYKKGVMQKVFSREIRFKEEGGSAFEEWEERKLGEFMSIPNKEKADNIDKDKLLTVKLHQKGLLKNKNTDSLNLGSTIYYKRNKGDFIYGKQNLFNGAFGIIPPEFDGFYTSGDIPTLSLNKNKIVSTFLIAFLGRPSFYSRLENIASGTGSKRIHENTLLNIKIAYPSLPEQQKIANFLTSLDRKIEAVGKELEGVKEWKKGLLQGMFV